MGTVKASAQDISGKFVEGVEEGNKLAEGIQKDIPKYGEAARQKIVTVKADVVGAKEPVKEPVPPS